MLYLLHGLSDDHTAWLRYTSIERYATARGLAVVMPAVHRSFYADEAHGHAYWHFVSEELPAIVAAFFRLSERREDTFVAGLSMGGYGALKLGLHHPERFAAVASLSGRRRRARAAAARRAGRDRAAGLRRDLRHPTTTSTRCSPTADPASLPPALHRLRHRGGPADGGQHPARRRRPARWAPT